MSDNPRKKGRVVVIGGGTLQTDNLGNYFVRTAVGQYLHELAHEIGAVSFAGYLDPFETSRFEYPLDSNRVHVYPLKQPGARGIIRQVVGWLQDMQMLIHLARKSDGVIEFHPGIGLSPFIRLFARRHIVYFGNDPRKRWFPILTRSFFPNPKKLYLLITGLLSEKYADAVLARDMAQVTSLQRFRDKVFLSPAITGIQPKDSVLLSDKCTQSTVRLLFVGKLTQRKGVTDLIEALACLNDTASERRFELTFVGAAVTSEVSLTPDQIKERAREIHVADHIRVTGFIDDMMTLEQIYRQTDIFILPSRLEGYPRVLDEAMAFGLPVVTTNLSEISSTLTNEQHALLVPTHDPRALAEAVTRIVSDASLRETLIHEGMQLARRRLETSAAQKHATILKSLPA